MMYEEEYDGGKIGIGYGYWEYALIKCFCKHGTLDQLIGSTNESRVVYPI